MNRHQWGSAARVCVGSGMREVTLDWENRLEITQPSLWARGLTLALRRCVRKRGSDNSKVAKKLKGDLSGYFQEASSAPICSS